MQALADECDERSSCKSKFIIVTGGVVSGIGKGVTASSIGVIMKMMGLRPTAIKIDPYLNVDAGTMSPFEHGEVFVLDDGGETDLDLGNYERFLDVRLCNDSNLTTGKIYQAVIEKERRGDYLGKTVQVVPHITNAIQEWIMSVSSKPVDGKSEAPDVVVIELGGTVGDIESMPFIEALRQMQHRVGYKNMCFVHVSMVPEVTGGEQKTKPTQHSVKEMRGLGLSPDFIVCRSARELSAGAREKLGLFCQVPDDHVITLPDVSNLYFVPLNLLRQQMHTLLAKRLRLGPFVHKVPREHDVAPHDSEVLVNTHMHTAWSDLARVHDELEVLEEGAKIGIVGKYTGLSDSYLSVTKALTHAATHTRQKLIINWINSEELEAQRSGTPEYERSWKLLKECDGILVPGGFGIRGIEGKVSAIKYARTEKKPFLGICLGLQAAVIEFQRNVCGYSGANSAEFAPSVEGQDAAVVFMPEGDVNRMGGTMRLGSRRTLLKENTLAFNLYGHQNFIDERHRHRYEVNPLIIEQLEANGLLFSGKDETGRRMEVIELPGHPYYLAVQFHPEFKSRPGRPSPCFEGLLQAVKRLKAQP